MKKLFAVLLALTLVLSMGAIAFAADNGTITISNALKDATYNIYKMFDFEPVAGSTKQGRYTVVAEWADFIAPAAEGKEAGPGAAYLVADAETGTIKWVGDETDARKAELAKLAIAYAKANGITASDTKTATADGAVTFENVALGYYAIDTSLGTICALTNVNSTFTATEKNEKPDLVKKIVEGNALVDANNVNIGDTITYQATITIGTGANKYVMHDKMSDTLKYTGITSVIVDGVAVNTGNYTVKVATAETPLADGCTFEIEFKDDYTKNLAKGTNIIVTYTAELLPTAVVGAEGNPNEAWLSYSDNHSSTHDFVITYTTKVEVEKVDGLNNPLAGAGFTLYKYDATIEKEDKWVAVGAQQLIESLEAGKKAIYTWNGLEEGTYKIVETKVPDGYNAASDIEFTITCEEPTTVNSAEATADWSSSNTTQITEANETFKATVVNKTGSLLPETGGIGTTIFYVVGGVLMAAALIVLVSKKRMASFA